MDRKIELVVTYEKEMGPNMKWVEVAPSKNEFTTLCCMIKI
uniref:Glyoxalase n=1 Tax=Clostridioides difficile TaxID=1496 RepID=A0A381KLC7_CLODI|nr:glyoxalase [Clostridioides difficile]